MGAAERAEALVAAVRDHPSGRRELAGRLYTGHPALGGPHGYGRSELAFLDWEIRRGVLNPLENYEPVCGSPWWRSVNEGLLRDATEAGLIADGGYRESPSNAATERWLGFVRSPSPASWYAAHNASIVTGYLQWRDLASRESAAEQALLNLVLCRVVFAHALVADARVALGRLAFMGDLLGNPRGELVERVLAMHEMYPDRYPLEDPDQPGGIPQWIVNEATAAVADDYLIRSNVADLFEFEANELDLPELSTMHHDGDPCYPFASTPHEPDEPPSRWPFVHLLQRFLGIGDEVPA